MKELFDPLSDDEIELLEDFLLDRIPEHDYVEGENEGILCVSELDGFLTAVVSGPQVIVPSRWLPVVWGEYEPIWDDIKDLEKILSLMTRHMNGIVATLIEAPEHFEAMFMERHVDGKTHVIVDEWCEGYARGFNLDREAWAAGGKELIQTLGPILAFTEETDWLAHSLPPDELASLRDAIEPAVRKVHAFWLARRGGRPESVRRSEPRVGRNDPCPCGSGKKYKKCCLQ